jgi:CubicO group peptidase (beta-lactamase class C family)
MNASLASVPGTRFVYSDVNFITLGLIVEKVSGEALDVYASEHIFAPLGMTHTRYLPPEKSCGASDQIPYAAKDSVSRLLNSISAGQHSIKVCGDGDWDATKLIPDIAATQHDNEGTAETNPDFDHLLRGTVHDPTTRRMGGVAGHAGVFSTAGDVAKFAQALLDKLLYDKGPFPLKQSTLRLMSTPEQPKTALGGATIFTADGTATTGVAVRGFGWDINSAFSRPRGSIFPIGSFGHTGFTGTTLWMDPGSDT